MKKLGITFWLTINWPKLLKQKLNEPKKTIVVDVIAGQPGLIFGKDNANIKPITLAINKIVGRKITVSLNVVTFENTAASARLIAREIANAIEKKVSFRIAQKMAIKKALQQGRVKGIKTNVSGRLGGVEMAREEGYSEGVIPLSTLRANIDYAFEIAHTKYGTIGVKVWINKGEYFKKNNKKPFTSNPKKWRAKNFEQNVLKLPKEGE